MNLLMLNEDKIEFIKKYVTDEIIKLESELRDKTLYKKNPYPNEILVMHDIPESEE